MKDKFTVSTVRTPSFEMDYLRFGNGDDVFVILPGLSIKSVLGSSAAIARQYASVAEKHTVFLFDRRKALPSHYTVEEAACDTSEAFDALGLRNVSLFGVSQGGMIAEVMAVKRSDLVGKLILGSTAAHVTDERFRTIERWIGLSEKGDRVGLFLDFGRSIYPREVFEKYRDALTAIAETVTEEELRRFEILAKGTKGFDMAGDLRDIPCPVFVIGARDDAVLGPDAADRIVGSLSKCEEKRLYIYDGYGHAAFDTAPDYCDRILDFLNGRS